MKKLSFIFVFVFCLLNVAMPVFAGGIFNSSNSVFALNPYIDTALLVSGAGLTGASFLMKPNVPAFDGKILDINSVNAFDRWLMRPYSKTLDKVATGLEITALLFPAVLMTEPLGEWGVIGTMYAETVLITHGTKEMFKLGIDRPRPFMYYEGYPEESIKDGDYLDSFFSGHSALSFASATFASYVFCKYNPDSEWKLPVVLGSYAIASTIAGLRLASGNHFLSDVLTGVAFGSAVGFLVPFLHTLSLPQDSSNSDSLAVNALPMGLVVSYNY